MDRSTVPASLACLPTRGAAALLIGFVFLSACTSQSSQVSDNAAGSTASRPEEAQEMLVYGKLPSFRLIDQEGAEFDSSCLDGQVYVANFFFTTCPTTCPQQSREVSALQRVAGLSMLSITVQPTVDTPSVLKKYAQQYNADPNKWTFLTGEREAIWELSQQGFMLPVGDAPPPAEMPIFHSSKIILVDGQQQIRGFYESQTRSEMVQLKKDAQHLISQQ